MHVIRFHVFIHLVLSLQKLVTTTTPQHVQHLTLAELNRLLHPMSCCKAHTEGQAVLMYTTPRHTRTPSTKTKINYKMRLSCSK